MSDDQIDEMIHGLVKDINRLVASDEKARSKFAMLGRNGISLIFQIGVADSREARGMMEHMDFISSYRFGGDGETEEDEFLAEIPDRVEDFLNGVDDGE